MQENAQNTRKNLNVKTPTVKTRFAAHRRLAGTSLLRLGIRHPTSSLKNL
jgi:hypothetical protein